METGQDFKAFTGLSPRNHTQDRVVGGHAAAISDVETQHRMELPGCSTTGIAVLPPSDGLMFEEGWNQKEVVDTEGEPGNYVSLHHVRLNSIFANREKEPRDCNIFPKS
jgi:hypothetical protein